MFFYEGQTCPVCGRHFGEQDDIVTCPECGAPHHRACWKQEGHCHFEELHGTDVRWDQQQQAAQETATQARTCPRCGYANPEFAEFCARCGEEFEVTDWQSAPPPPAPPPRPPVGQYTPHGGAYPPFGAMPVQDPYGGVPRDAVIEGVPVNAIVEQVGQNSAYYLPRFYRMANGGSKVSWNWAAMFFESKWLLYRKNCLWGLLSFVVLTALSLLNELWIMPQWLTAAGVKTTEDLLLTMDKWITNETALKWYGLFALITLIMVAAQVLIGMFGNYLYMRSVLRKIKKQGPQSPYGSQGMFTSGGVSFFLAILPQLVVTVALNVILYILLML